MNTPLRFLLAALTANLLLLTVASWPAWRLAGFDVAGARARRGAWLAIGALLLFTAQGLLPDRYTIGLASLLTIIGVRSVYGGARALFDFPDPPRAEAALASLAVVALGLLSLPIPGFAPPARLIALLGSVPVTLATLHWMVQLLRRAPRPWTLGTRYLVWSAELAALIQAGRTLELLVDPPASAHTAELATAIAVTGLMAAGTLMAFGLILHIDAHGRERLRLESERLAQAAQLDGLTSLFNRRHLESRAPVLVQAAREKGHPLTFMLLDIDHFKQVNDTFGHAAGDQVLAAVAASLRQSVRGHDLIARWGGEEFAILLPSCDGVIAERIADRIVRKIARSPQVALQGAPVTVSIGLTALLPHDDGLSALFARADGALYAAKHAGRNQFQRAPAAEPEAKG